MKMNKREKIIEDAASSAGFGIGVLFIEYLILVTAIVGFAIKKLGIWGGVAFGIALAWLTFSKLFDKIINKLYKNFFKNSKAKAEFKAKKRGK